MSDCQWQVCSQARTRLGLPWWLGRLGILLTYSGWFCFWLSQQLSAMQCCHFYHNQWSHRSKVYQSAQNWPAYLEYGRRMQKGFAYGLMAMCTADSDLIQRVKKGQLAGDELERQSQQLLNEALDSRQQFDGQDVPDLMAGPHQKISRAFSLCHESTVYLREAQEAEGAERERLVKEAEKKSREAWAMQDRGIKEFATIWAATRVPSVR